MEQRGRVRFNPVADSEPPRAHVVPRDVAQPVRVGIDGLDDVHARGDRDDITACVSALASSYVPQTAARIRARIASARNGVATVVVSGMRKIDTSTLERVANTCPSAFKTYAVDASGPNRDADGLVVVITLVLGGGGGGDDDDGTRVVEGEGARGAKRRTGGSDYESDAGPFAKRNRRTAGSHGIGTRSIRYNTPPMKVVTTRQLVLDRRTLVAIDTQMHELVNRFVLDVYNMQKNTPHMAFSAVTRASEYMLLFAGATGMSWEFERYVVGEYTNVIGMECRVRAPDDTRKIFLDGYVSQEYADDTVKKWRLLANGNATVPFLVVVMSKTM